MLRRKYQRSGTLWEGRFRSSITQEKTLLHCHRYIELNPVRAEMVLQPKDYSWSSYHSNAPGQENKLLKPHAIYKQLGMTAQDRQKIYRQLFRSKLKSEVIDGIRKMTNGNYVLGNERFKEKIGKMLGRRVTPSDAE
ncbi:MAG: transposase [Gammaproteobacteria bacterium]|nr:transposase [Gammaproteobacteria bacterium]